MAAKQSNNLHIWGNRDSMNLNSMILTNIQSSNYFKNNLYELKTYHEVIDEIYYRVKHLEPWEKGSRKTQGLTGMCGGVRGVGGGGIVSTAFCILYKLYTLKLTRKQVLGLMVHKDSPYIRGLGFMYVRYTQAPGDLWDWYEPYLDDPEEIDVKAGGGFVMTIGNMLKQWLTRLEWFETLFPRIPVPIQQQIEFNLREKYGPAGARGDDTAVGETEVNGRAGSKRSPPTEIIEALKRTYKSRSRSRSKARSGSSRSRSVSSDRKHHHRHHHKKHKHHKHKRSSSSSKGGGDHHRPSHHHKHRRSSKERRSRSRSRSETTKRKQQQRENSP